MKLGLIARADNRGLGVMTQEFHDHLHPERTLVVREPGAERHGFVPHPDRFPSALVTMAVGGVLPEAVVRDWLDGLDVVYSAETFYDQRLPGWAEEAGVATVLHAMPEFYRPEMRPTVCWAPTGWRLDLLPDPVVMPVPVPFSRPAPPRDGPLRVLHVVGRRAAGDRNGTLILGTALRLLDPMVVRMETQEPRLPAMRRGRVDLRTHLGGREDRWTMYADADVLVMPRRYGGLCLPAQEALACGLALVMTDCEPNNEWPIVPVFARPGVYLPTPGGPVQMHSPDPAAVARVLNALARDPEAVADLQAASQAWAVEHTWLALAPRYRLELERVLR